MELSCRRENKEERGKKIPEISEFVGVVRCG